MRPFWNYYGGKYRAAMSYPPPRFGTIVEPFAGAAGYSTRYADRRVILCDADPVIAGLWSYLIRADGDEILSLPVLQDGQTVDDLGVCQEARWLIGFFVNTGAASPCKSPSKWMREYPHLGCFWNERTRATLAAQVGLIKHWQVHNCSWDKCPSDGRATWFIDPPYALAGKHYKHGSSGIDYNALGAWCKTRDGQVIVCENDGADWLPFRPHRLQKANSSGGVARVSREVVWTNGTEVPNEA